MPTPEPVTELVELLHLQPTQSVIDTLAGWYNTHASINVTGAGQVEKPFVSGGLPPYTYVAEKFTLTAGGLLTADVLVTDADGAKITKTFTAQL